MWHGSHTYVGFAFDNRLMSVLAYLSHQISVQYLPTNSSVVHDLSTTPRNGTSISVTNDLLLNMSKSTPVQWAEFVDHMDIELNYYNIFAAQLITVGSLLAPFWLIKPFFSWLVNLALPPKDAQFITQDYMPAIHDATHKIFLDLDERKLIVRQFIGMFMKILWAFTFQEHVVNLWPLYNPVALSIAAFFMP